ncbi:MAG: phosphoenolpyruvate synthase [Gammaproteobacteria bacterium]|nr:phosphoenolpyruvate synthase [Gammaproteobacteria bacterium]|tara:strand:+ start:2306 stop:4675 length:2370 start_codon:yes stop_codon:yes gene_type:complete
MQNNYISKFSEILLQDIEIVGGKNASLGEMINNLTALGINVPDGFATTSQAYNFFLKSNGLDVHIEKILKDLDISSIKDLERCGKEIRNLILNAEIPKDLEDHIYSAWQELSKGRVLSFAVRSSATAEDLPSASFAGQQETYLNVTGFKNLINAMQKVFASLYTDRAISYRVHQGFSNLDISISVGFQQMVRSDMGASGVMFTLDTESGCEDVIFINASYGLGETIVQGSVNPDEFYVFKKALSQKKLPIIRKNLGDKSEKMIFTKYKEADASVKIVPVAKEEQTQFSLTDDEIIKLSELGLIIEKHYGKPMDIEWGKDGQDGKIYILQARPETVHSKTKTTLSQYVLNEKSKIIITGKSIGQRIGLGATKIIEDPKNMYQINEGDILVADMTDPDWEPVMKKAAAIITNRGGRTCHAAIIARELGIPAIVGTNDATKILKNNKEVTVCCSEGEVGRVYEGLLKFDVVETEISNLPNIPTKLMMNVGNPDRAFTFSRIPNEGVGLARLEFIINKMIGIHPKALLSFSNLDQNLKKQIQNRISGYETPIDFYVKKLSEGIATIAAAFNEKPVIVRMSDFKSNEYANLLGGEIFEPKEENPMLGFRGAGRYISKSFRQCFEMECEAIKRVRNEMGLRNIQIMIPFIRTINEAQLVIELLKQNGLESGKEDLKIIMMSELPSNALLADQFLEFFDGMSIGSNDMTQLTLGLDRDSALVADVFDERDDAVKSMLSMSINACHRKDKYIGICGQGPSDHDDLALWLLEQNIESISLNPDTVIKTWLMLAKINKK